MHGGGQDLVFPHHENEIAQSEGATEKPFVRYWIHNGLINLKGEKMSKSTGHFFSVEDVNKDFSGDVIRFYLLSTHFRSNSEFSEERLREAEAGLDRITNLCTYIDEKLSTTEVTGAGESAEGTEGLRKIVQDVRRDFEEAMDDDFNSGEAIGHVFRLVKEVNRVRSASGERLAKDRRTLESIRDAMRIFDSVLGLYRGGLPTASLDVPDEVMGLVAEREEARRTKDWKRADELRNRVLELGYTIEDRADGPALKRFKDQS
jgi:cysteinyl-tRNA synthetase